MSEVIADATDSGRSGGDQRTRDVAGVSARADGRFVSVGSAFGQGVCFGVDVVPTCV